MHGFRGAMIAAAVILVAPAGRAGAGAAPGTFRKLHFEVDVRAQLPKCGAPGAGHRCWQPPPACAGTDCETPWSIRFDDSLNDLLYDTRVHQTNGRLAAVSSSFRSQDLMRVEDLLRAKYGTPSLAKKSPLTLPNGTQTVAVHETWKWKGLVIDVHAPAGDVASGKLLVATTAYAAHRRQEDEDTFERQLDDL